MLTMVYAHKWPFTRQAVIESLQLQTASRVDITSFRSIYFPHPGCVATGITFHRDGSQPPFITIRQLTIVGSYMGLVTGHLSQVRVEGARLVVNRRSGSNAGPSTCNAPSAHSGLTIGELDADGALIEVIPVDATRQPLVFTARKLLLHSITADYQLSFDSAVEIPEPRGLAYVSGRFGPWRTGQAGQTPLSGSYKLVDGDLSSFTGIAGILSSEGTFGGALQRLMVDGSTEMPDFALTRSRHLIHLTTTFHAFVNGLDGDVVLDPVVGHTSRTTVVFQGQVSGEAGQEGKTVSLKMYSNQARIQDLMWPFIQDKQPPMLGDINFQAQVSIPPGEQPFLAKLKLGGDFGIARGKYTSANTQKAVDVMSARARGEADKVEDENDKRGGDSYDPGQVLSGLKGHVVLSNGVARFTDIAFNVPGAMAQGGGTFNLQNERLNLQGTVQMDAHLSQATTGVKSFLLKLVEPLIRKKNQVGSTVMVKMEGTYRKPSFIVLPNASK